MFVVVTSHSRNSVHNEQETEKQFHSPLFSPKSGNKQAQRPMEWRAQKLSSTPSVAAAATALSPQKMQLHEEFVGRTEQI